MKKNEEEERREQWGYIRCIPRHSNDIPTTTFQTFQRHSNDNNDDDGYLTVAAPELAQNPNGNFTVLNGIGLKKSFQTDHQFIQDLGTFNDRV